MVLLGHGSFGKVFTDPQDFNRAMKIAPIYENDQLVVSNLKETIFALLYLSQPQSKNLIRFTDVEFDENDNSRLFMRREKGNMIRYVRTTPFAIRMQQSESIVEQILRGVDSLHQLGISHGDLKPGNLLYSIDADSNVNVVIADIGNGMLVDGGSDVCCDG
jgi:serine/threonine protein kinase